MGSRSRAPLSEVQNGHPGSNSPTMKPSSGKNSPMGRTRKEVVNNPHQEQDSWAWNAFGLLAVAIIEPLRIATPLLHIYLASAVVLAFLGRWPHSIITNVLLVYSIVEVMFYWFGYRVAKVRLQRRHTPPLLPLGEVQRLAKRCQEETGDGDHFLDFWFPGAKNLSGVGLEDLRDWVCWAFFGRFPGELREEELAEVERLITGLEEQQGMKFSPGHSGCRALRLNLDPVPAQHRPLVYYAATGAMDVGTKLLLRFLGFRGYSLKSMSYLLKEPIRGKPASAAPPIVFVHGVGMGLATYIVLLVQLAMVKSDRRILLLELPHVSMRLGRENVPSIASIVESCDLILQKHRLAPALWLSHSLGTFISAAVIKQRPHLVHSVVMVDPVCFLLWEVDLIYNFCERKPRTASQRIQHYHISQELYISHYFRRHFWWYEVVLFADELPERNMTFLSGADDITNPERIAQYLKEKGVSRHVFPGLNHGGWLLDPSAWSQVLAAL